MVGVALASEAQNHRIDFNRVDMACAVAQRGRRRFPEPALSTSTLSNVSPKTV
jgi:hypothetical protein